MYQRILVPVDGSATSARVLQEAIKLAAGNAQLRLIHVIEEIYPLDTEGYAYIDYIALQEAVRHTGERVADVIESAARDWPADLIVIGTHGRSGLSRLLLGSVAEGVARGAPVPVLLVRSEPVED